MRSDRCTEDGFDLDPIRIVNYKRKDQSITAEGQDLLFRIVYRISTSGRSVFHGMSEGQQYAAMFGDCGQSG